MNIAKKEVAASLAIGLIACFLPRLFPPGEWDSIIPISLCAGFLWLIVLIIVLVRQGKKGVWFLVGLPFALYWPAVLVILTVACWHDARYCP